MVNAVAINSSPQMNSGNTALVLNPLIEGMKDAGARVQLLFTKKLKILPCSGEFQCWDKTPGKCYIRDDMEKILPILRDAEIWVLGIPLYVPMPGEMQNLINRTMPLLTHEIDVRGRRMFPHRRDDFRLRRVALVSSCAYWEMENFDKRVCTIEETAEALGAEFSGSVLRPHAGVMKRMPKSNRKVAGVLQATKKAGSELVRKGTMSKRTLGRISAPLITFEEYLK